MICFPNAKINLGLSVIEKRTDGMHNIQTCYIPIAIYDILEIQPSNKFSLIQSGLSVGCEPELNLINKAWTLLLSAKANIKPVSVRLHKNIPVGSGLGGGSSDAAFFIKAVNQLYALNISTDELEMIASEVGADCPFFIKNIPTIATDIGNVFMPIENPINSMYMSVVFPNIKISTTNSYENISPKKGHNLKTVLNTNKSNWKTNLINDFEEAVIKDFPEIQKIKTTLYKLGATYVSLTGSGSAIYALSEKPLKQHFFNPEYRVWLNALTL